MFELKSIFVLGFFLLFSCFVITVKMLVILQMFANNDIPRSISVTCSLSTVCYSPIVSQHDSFNIQPKFSYPRVISLRGIFIETVYLSPSRWYIREGCVIYKKASFMEWWYPSSLRYPEVSQNQQSLWWVFDCLPVICHINQNLCLFIVVVIVVFLIGALLYSDCGHSLIS